MSKALVVLVLLLPFCCWAQQEPSNFPGLQLWLRSDTGVVINASNKVSDWFDISGTGNHAFQATTNFRPNLMEDVIMGYPSVWFDGANDWLNFPELTDIRTVFWVVVEHGDATIQGRCLLGHNAEFDFFRGPAYNMWHGTFASQEVLTGTTRVNFSEVNGTTTTVPHEFSILSLVTSGNTSASRFSLDRELFANVWDGELVELIIFNTPLSNEDVLQVENYLADRYTEPFYADDDVFIDYGFCDTTICAAPGFSNYLWSTGEQTQCIEVNSSGSYAIQAEDAFHRLRLDTVTVAFPGNLDFTNSTICLGDQIVFNTELSSDDYTFIWQDESGLSEFTASEPGSYFVVINDTLACSSVSTTAIVEVDSLAVLASIGSSPAVCAGDYLSIVNAPFPLDDVLWNDDSTQESIQVFDSGLYSVQVTDVFGCAFSGQIDVIIAGEAPVPDFLMSQNCVEETVTFSDNSVSSATISQWNWIIDTVQVSSSSEAEFLFSVPGFYSVQFDVETIEGCSASIDSTIIIHPTPTVVFGHTLPCAGYNISLYDLSVVNGGAIVGWDWDINGVTFSNAEVVVTSVQADLEVSLIVESEAGCVGVLNQIVDLLPSPEVNFNYEGICYGGLTIFEEDVSVGAGEEIVDYDWSFGDNTTSGLANPTHFFTQAGIYEVVLGAESENGCYASITQNVEIFDLPYLSFGPNQACIGQPAIIEDYSITNGGEWDSIRWIIPGLGEISVPEPIVEFDALGSYNIYLYKSTTNGCSSTVVQPIVVVDVPQATFTMSSSFGPPPLEVNFLASSDSENTFEWEFGDGSSSSGEFTNHTYLEFGVFVASLASSNPEGCTSITAQQVFVIEPQPDVLVDAIYCEETPNGLQIAAIIQNLSGFQINDLQISWQIGNDAPVSELWTGQLLDGQAFLFEFESLANPRSSNYNYLCISVSELTTGFADVHPENNEKCKVLEPVDQAQLLPVFPNPAQDYLQLSFLMPEDEKVKITIWDSRGKLVFDGAEIMLNSGYSNRTIDISNLRAGTYHIQVNGSSSALNASFLVTEP